MRAALVALLLCGCGATAGDSLPTVPSGRFTEAEWSTVLGLSPESLPSPPPDVTNRYADDEAAATLGGLLFADKSFSGALLDIDNDGGPSTLGQRGAVGKVACAGCHMAESGFSDTRSTFQEISLGAGWTRRRTPSLLDVGQARLFTWSGGRSTLFGQVFGPLENPLEMNGSRLFAATYIADHYKAAYEGVFGAGTLDALADTGRFVRLAPEANGCRLTSAEPHPRAMPPNPLYVCHGVPGDGAEYDALSSADQAAVTGVVANMGKAIAAFERTLTCGPGRFDAYVHGDDEALSEAEQRGLGLFIGKAGCVACHSGPFFSDQAFHNVGLAVGRTREGILNDGDHGALVDLAFAATDPLGVHGPYSDGDDGRLPADIGASYDGAFRTPTLRCVAGRPTFMHDGLLLSLEQVVAFFDRGGDPANYPGTKAIAPLGLTPDERRDLTAFLRAL